MEINLIALYGSGLVIMFASLIGVISVWSGFGRWLEENLAHVTSFAAGVFSFVASHLIYRTLSTTGILPGTLYITLGVLVVYGLFRTLPFFHHHHTSENEHSHTRPEAFRILFSDGIHNIGDGLLLVAGFQASLVAGLGASIAVFVHELVQEISEFFVLRASGFSTTRTLLYNFVVSSTILIGVAIGLLATTQIPDLRSAILGIAAGSFLVVVTQDLVPHSIRTSSSTTDITRHVSWFAYGVAVMMLIFLLIGHL